MRRIVPVVLAAAAVATASAGFAWAASPGGSAAAADAATAARRPVHAVLWIGEGALQACGPQDCTGGGVDRPFTMPGHGTYTASVTLSFQYKARGTGTFSAGIGFGKGARTLPRRRALAPAPTPASATLVFRTHLVGGRQYDMSPTVDVADAGNTYSINQRALLVEIDATPSHAATKMPAGPFRRTQHSWARS
jgi:hypothetical protein